MVVAGFSLRKKMGGCKEVKMSTRQKLITSITFIFLLIFLLPYCLLSQESKDPNLPRQFKIKITSPKPGEIIKGTVPIKWEVVQTSESINESKNNTENPTPDQDEKVLKYIIHHYLDFQLIAETTDLEPTYELDTTQFKNGVHIITINVIDTHPHIATYGVKVRIKN